MELNIVQGLSQENLMLQLAASALKHMYVAQGIFYMKKLCPDWLAAIKHWNAADKWLQVRSAHTDYISSPKFRCVGVRGAMPSLVAVTIACFSAIGAAIQCQHFI